MGEKAKEALRLQFDRRLRLEFHGARITSDAGHGRRRAVCGFSASLTAVGQGITIGLDGDEGRVCLHQELKWGIPV